MKNPSAAFLLETRKKSFLIISFVNAVNAKFYFQHVLYFQRTPPHKKISLIPKRLVLQYITVLYFINKFSHVLLKSLSEICQNPFEKHKTQK